MSVAELSKSSGRRLLRLPGFLEQWINDRFGSKKGLMKLSKARVEQLFGRYRKHGEVNFSQVKRLVFICTGNICRSPLGEYYARSLGIEAISFGLDTRGGDPADPRAVNFAARQGLDMSGHVTTTVDQVRLKPGDLLLVMEPAQYDQLARHEQKQQWPAGIQKAILPLFKRRPVPYLHDPYSATGVFFDHCERQVVEAVDGLARRMSGF